MITPTNLTWPQKTGVIAVHVGKRPLRLMTECYPNAKPFGQAGNATPPLLRPRPGEVEMWGKESVHWLASSIAVICICSTLALFLYSSLACQTYQSSTQRREQSIYRPRRLCLLQALTARSK